MRYSAFVSYNHRDVAWARWLLRSLEAYKIPKHLRGLPSRMGPIGTRLPPVFRDRDELAASNDLSGAVRAALDQSATLVVLCSPNSRQSRWVNEEIRYFAALGRADGIRCLIIGGEPNAARPDEECMPPALSEVLSTEPLAADARTGQDGRSVARLKIIAGILEIPYDEIRQRESQRRQKRLLAFSAAATIGLILTSSLAIFALLSRAEAVRQRDLARQKTAIAQRTVRYVKGLFEVGDPSEARGAAISVQDVIDRGSNQLRAGTSLQNQPEVRADLGATLSEVYGSLGSWEKAEGLARWTFSIPQSDPVVRFHQLIAYADALRRQGNPAAAMRAASQAIAIGTSSGLVDEQQITRGYIALGEAQIDEGQTELAKRSLGLALRRSANLVGPGNTDAAIALEDLGRLAIDEDDQKSAASYLSRAAAIRSQFEGALSPGLSDDLGALATVATRTGDYRRGINLLNRQLAIDAQVLGKSHPDYAMTLNNLARAHIESRNLTPAIPLLQQALAVKTRRNADAEINRAVFYSNLGLAQSFMGKRHLAKAALAAGRKIADSYKSTMRGPIRTAQAKLACEVGDIRQGMQLAAEAGEFLREDYPQQTWRLAWNDISQAPCLEKTDPRHFNSRMRQAARIVLARWPSNTLFGNIARSVVARLHTPGYPAGR